MDRDSIGEKIEPNDENIIGYKLFKKYVASNGLLDIDAFTKLISSLFNETFQQLDPLQPVSFSNQVVQVFNTFDLKNDGFIDKDEFGHMWTNWLSIVSRRRAALILVDIQNDFITGSLALEKLPAGQFCYQIIPTINSLIDTIPFEMVVYTLDWHPVDHISFVDNANSRIITKLNDVDLKNRMDGGSIHVQPFDKLMFNIDGQFREQVVYPAHCIQSSWGSELHSDLKIAKNCIKIYKGTDPNVDSYSAFKDNEGSKWTELDYLLKAKGIVDVCICGLAYDICVYYTALDALSLKYRTVLIEDCCKGTEERKIDQVRSELVEKGCIIVDSSNVAEMVNNISVNKSWQSAYQEFLDLQKLSN